MSDHELLDTSIVQSLTEEVLYEWQGIAPHEYPNPQVF